MSGDILSSLGSLAAGANPAGSAINGITGLASGGPSGAESGGNDTLTTGSITIGGNGYLAADPKTQSAGGFLSSEYLGVPAFMWVGVMAMIAVVGAGVGR